MEYLHLNIISPQESLFKGEVSEVTLPGSVAPFTILPHHAPIISSLEKGAISFIVKGGGSQSVEIDGGFVEMSNGNVTVCIC
ncbi:MAG: F0F1 ATP synthase subunit epsilon [Bacteroidales bacterium]|nr:F0F1 ATP synthase subunit epsilon [Bacteroidales bacterium]